MAKIVVEVKNLKERNLVRAAYKSAHCRPIKNGKGYYIFYTDKKKQARYIAEGMSRAEAWVNAAEIISRPVQNKLES